VVIARQVDAGTPSATEETAPYPFAKFSPAARLIGQLLPAEGQTAPAVQLNRGQPLLPQAPQTQAAAVQLAPVLAKAVTQSGMFYEAHQAQWVAGKLPLEHLLQEPQGQRSSPALLEQAAAANVARPATQAAPAVNANSILQALAPGADKVGPAATAGTQPVQAMLAQQVPDDLRPLVQQQLEAGASQRMFWHGTVWPQQTLDWAIECSSEREADGKEEQEGTWRTALSLTTPRLGHIDASLQLSAGGVRITIAASDVASAGDLRAAAPQLAAALEAAGLALHGFQVRHGETKENA
jgi:hypothetical protein